MNRPIIIGILGTLVIMALIMSALNTGDFRIFLDLRSILFVFGISATAAVITAQGTKQRIKVFSRFAEATGWLGFIIGLILILGDIDFVIDSEAIYPAISIALLPIFYGYLVKLFCGVWLRVIKIRNH